MLELTNTDFRQVLQAKPMQAFDPHVIAFLDAVSKAILRETEVRHYPDLATLGFFLRRKNLYRISRCYLAEDADFLMGRGLAFHVGPANVPLNFAYSLAAALLAGNPSVVRVSSQPFPQVDLFVAALNEVMATSGLSQMLSILRYEHESEMNAYLSKACDIRIIWGGNQTIEAFAKVPLPAHVTQIHFANRYSAAIVDARYYLDHCAAEDIAQKFFNDVYPFEQNACTAPKLMFWLGSEESCQKAKDRFWSALRGAMVQMQYQPSEGVGVRHFKSAAQLAVAAPLRRAITAPGLTVLDADTVAALRPADHVSEGFFLQRRISTLSELEPHLDRACQTLAFVGDLKTEILSCIAKQGMKGVDRVVPIGSTGHFSFLWEGKDLIRLMSRSFKR